MCYVLEPLGINGVVGFARDDELLLWTTKYRLKHFGVAPVTRKLPHRSTDEDSLLRSTQLCSRWIVNVERATSSTPQRRTLCHVIIASWRLNYTLEHIIHTSTLVTVFTVRVGEHNCIVIIIISKYSGLDDKCVFQPIAVESLGPLNETACHFLKDLGRRISAQSGDERECLPVPKVICCHSAIQRYLAPPQFWGGRPPGLMVIPAFTFSNHFFLALGIGDALGTEK